MAKSQSLPFLAPLCLLLVAAPITTASAADPAKFVVQGKVYCDNCRAGFETTLTDYIEGAKVKLECRNGTTHEILYAADGVTDSTGTYNIGVDNDHEDEICETMLVSSPDKECNEIKGGRERARIVITGNSGISSNVRYANSLGFMREEPLEICGELLAQYALNEDED